MNRLLLFSLLFISNILQAQRDMDIQSNILDRVQAERVIDTPDEYNLKGKVKHVLEVNTTQNDTLLLLQFNAEGKSILVQEADYSVAFTYKNDQLLSTTSMRNSYPHDTVVSRFNSKGQLTQSTVRYQRQYEPEETTIKYTYLNGWKNITLKYGYSFDASGWDVVSKDEYLVSFDKEGRVSNVKNKSYHKEYTYAYNRSYGYDTLGRMVHVTLVDKDAGSNSALSLWLSIRYNDEEHSMTESLVDHTVRNSLWSYGYTKYERYNENGDIIKSDYHRQDEHSLFPEPIIDKKLETPKFEPTFDYDYDAHGNWTTKYLVQNNQRLPIATREIDYFE